MPPASAGKGFFWKLLSCACFAAINGVVRYLTKEQADLGPALSTATVTFFQNVFGTLLLLPMIYSLGFKQLQTPYKALHLVRVVTAVLGIVLWYEAIKHMQIPQAVALNFTGPIFTVLAAWFILSERLSGYRIAVIGLSVIGAFIISRPDIALMNDAYPPLGKAVFFPIASAIVLAFNKILTRHLAIRKESPESLAIYLLVFMTPVSGVFAYLHGFTMPSLPQLAYLALGGALAAGAHFSFAKAYQLAEVTFLMPFGFFKFFMSMLVSYLAFSELPPANSPFWPGAALIFISVTLLGMRDKRARALA